MSFKAVVFFRAGIGGYSMTNVLCGAGLRPKLIQRKLLHDLTALMTRAPFGEIQGGNIIEAG